MNGIVLCEGETDQILLNKYFCNRYGFKYIEDDSKPMTAGKHSCRYERNYGDVIHISYVGGKDKFPQALEKILKINRFNVPKTSFDYIAIIMDHDSHEEVQEMMEKSCQVLQKYGKEIGCSKFGHWKHWEQEIGFEESKQVYFLLMPIPVRGEGALETFLLNALSEKRKNSYIVQQSNEFVMHLMGTLNRWKLEGKTEYFPDGVLKSRRLQTKAPLAVYFGIVNPERTFAKYEDILNSIDWSKYEKIQTDFMVFEDMMK